MIPTGTIAGVTKPVSRIICGTQVAEPPGGSLDAALPIWDAYVEPGGNTFDTAHAYGDGATDSALGHWLSTRGVRDSVVVIGKGAHTPLCDPEHVTSQLHESLHRLRTDHLDLYFLHRDNLEVPAGEFVDVLNEHVQAGRIHAFGGSNWASARIDEANDYAAAKGLVGMTAVSNQFSLARMVQQTFPGTASANEPTFVEWLAARELPLIAWSSQAAGFFTGLQPDGPLAHAWFDDDNLERRRRVEQLAAERGIEPVTLALAWVLHQSLRIFPIIGPRRLVELETSLAALDLELTADEVAWLDLRR